MAGGQKTNKLDVRKYWLANALMTALADCDCVDPELLAVATSLSRECGFEMPVETA